MNSVIYGGRSVALRPPPVDSRPGSTALGGAGLTARLAVLVAGLLAVGLLALAAAGLTALATATHLAAHSG